QDRRWDPEARRKVRQLVADNFGVFGQMSVLRAQNDYLNNDGTAAALDSEIALLWWGYYNRSNWMTNPLHYKAPQIEHPPVLMVTRLDGPQEGTAMQIVLA